MNKETKQLIISFIFLTLGSVVAAFALEEFLVPNKVFDGGVTGICMILNHFIPVKLGLLVIIINIPFIMVGLKKLGKMFIIKAIYSLILNNKLAEATVDALTVNGTDVAFLPSIQAADDNSYTLQVSATGSKTATVFVNGIPHALDANGMLVVPAVTGVADSVVVIVSQDGLLDKAYTVTVTAAPVTVDQAVESVADTADTAAGDVSGETVENAVNPEIPV